MFRQLIKPHHFITVFFIGVFTMSFILMEDYSFAQRERRGDDSSRVSRQQERRGDDSPRVSRQQERRGDDSPRVSRQQDRRGDDSPRVSRQQDKRRDDSSRVSRQQERRGDDSSRVSRQQERRGDDSSRVSRQQERRGSDSPRIDRNRNKRRIISPSSPRYGYVVPKLPRGYRRIWHKSKPYYYIGGVFYTPGPTGFIVVRAPIGSIVVSLPVGFRRIWVGDAYYYTYGGTFYRRAPSGFVVVAPPAEVVLEEDAPVIVKPSEAAAGQVSVTASILNVRSGPDFSYPLIYQVHSGYILEVHGQSREWLYVELPNGEFGWVMAKFTYRLEAPGSG